MTLVELFQKSVAAHGHRPAIFFGEDKLSYRSLLAQSQSFAAVLGHLGIQPGDRVAILLKNCPEYVACLYGIFQVGATAVPLNTFLKSAEVEFMLRDSATKLLITSAEFNDLTERVRQGVEGLAVYKLGGTVALPASPPNCPEPRVDESTLASIVYTSGTTGKPKGAMLTHGNLASNVTSCIQLLEADPRDRFTLMLPMFHSFMLTVCIFTPLSMGASIILVRSLQPFKPVIQEFVKRRATILIGIPQIFQAMAHAKLPFWVHWVLNFRLAVSGSAPLSMETLQTFSRNFRFPLCEGYGLSEAAPVVRSGEHTSEI